MNPIKHLIGKLILYDIIPALYIRDEENDLLLIIYMKFFVWCLCRNIW